MINFEFQDKQERFEQRLVKQILVAHGMPQTSVGYHARTLGDEMNLRWFNEEFHDCPVAIESRKVKSPVSTSDIFCLNNKHKKTEWWKCYEEARDNWPDRNGIAVIFDYHGDDIPDLVLHNRTDIYSSKGFYSWPSDQRYLECWKTFLEALTERWRYQ
jgi:hypothetical protein